MPNLKFKETTVHRLISEVKNYECIWNTEHENYNEKMHTAPAWMDIATKLQLPAELLRIKWKNLRDGYRKELKKHNLKPGDCYSGKWQYFEAISFLGFSEYNDTDVNSELVDSYFMEINENDQQDSSSERLPRIKKRKNDETYDLMFLESLLPFLRDLEPMRKLVFRSKIHELLMNELTRSTGVQGRLN